MRVGKSLPFGPNGPGRVKSLQFNSDEVANLSSSNRRKAVINASAWHIEFRDDMPFVARLVQRRQRFAIFKNLPTL